MASAPTPVDPLYFEVHALMQEGDYQAALRRLDGSPVLTPRTHHRQRAYALHNLFRYEEAHAEIRLALANAEGNALGSVYTDWAVMLIRENRYEEGYDCYLRALALIDQPAVRITPLYNLGWTYLRQLKPGLALAALEEAQHLIRRSKDPHLRWWLTFVRCAQALHARLAGDWVLALDRAHQAVREAPSDRAGVFALNTLASTQRLSGDLDAAALSQERALTLAREGQAQLTETLHLHLIDLQRGEDREQALSDLIPLAFPYDAWRARLHLAQVWLKTGRRVEALTVLQAAVHVQEPYVLLDESPALDALYAFGRAEGLHLPMALPSKAPRLHLITQGTPGLVLDDRLLPLSNVLTVGVLLYLNRQGPAAPETLARALLDLGEQELSRGVARVRTAVGELRYWVGSDELVRRNGRRLTLDPRWTVTDDLLNLPHRGQPLAELYGPWVLDLSGAR